MLKVRGLAVVAALGVVLAGCAAPGGSAEVTPTPTEEFVQAEPGFGVPIRVVQEHGVAEITIHGATFNQDAPGLLPFVPEGDDGYLILDATWTTLEGETSIVANFWMVRDSAGVDGAHFIFVERKFAAIDLPAGESISGDIGFEIAPGPYTFIIFDDGINEVARFEFEAQPRESDGVR